MTRYLFIFIILFSNLSLANNIPELLKKDNIVMRTERIANYFNKLPDDFKTQKAFLNQLDQYAKNNNDLEIKIIHKNLLATALAKTYDSNNPKSNALYAEALELSNKSESLNLWTNINYAFYLYSYRKLGQSLQFFINSMHLSEKLEDTKIINASDTFKKIGFFLGTIGDYNNAIDYLNKGLNNSTKKERASILDNIGNYYISLNQHSKAEQTFLEALNVVSTIDDEVRKGKILGNLALIKQAEKKYVDAQKLLEEDLVYSEKHKDDKNTMHASIQLAGLFLEQNKIENAKKSISIAEAIANSKSYYKISLYQIYKLKFKIANIEKNDTEELFIRRKLSQLEEELNNADGEKVSQTANWLLKKEQYSHKLNLANAQYEREASNKKIIILVSILLILIVIGLNQYSIKKLKAKQHFFDKKILNLQIEKLKSERNLKENTITIVTYKEYLDEKNKQIDDLQSTINKMSNSKDFKLQKLQLQELLNSHLMTEENWNNFKIAFRQEHEDFYNRVITDFPEATESNLRIIFLMKLGLSFNQISALLGITVDSIRKSNQRLRKKLGSKSETLFEMITD